MKIDAFTRFYVADLARRGHALADGTSEEHESPHRWIHTYREVRSVLERVADIALRNSFAEAADGDDDDADDDGGLDAVWELRQMGDDAQRLTRAQRRALEQVASALDGLVNGTCAFAPDEGAMDNLPAFLRVAIAAARERVVRVDVVGKVRPEFSGTTWARYGATLLDRGLAQTLYRDYMHIQVALCKLWLEENDPMTNKPTEIRYGDSYVVGNAAAVGPGASAPGAIVQDNQHGGSGSIDVAQADVATCFTQLVSAVNERDDAPGNAIVAAAEAKAASTAKEATKAIAALRKGGGWLAAVAKEVASKMGAEYLLQQLGLG